MYNRVINAVKRAQLEDKQVKLRKIKAQWWHGVPGAGKSFSARSWADSMGLDYFTVTKQTYPWFDGYEGEPVLIIDDLNDDWISQDSLHTLLEGHKAFVNIKGDMLPALWKYVIITSNYNVKHVYSQRPDAVKRRLERVVNYQSKHPEAAPIEPDEDDFDKMSDDEKESVMTLHSDDE